MDKMDKVNKVNNVNNWSQYIFGKFTQFQREQQQVQLEEIVKDLSVRKKRLSHHSLEKIIQLLHHFGQQWKENSPWFQAAYAGLRQSSSLSDDELKRSLLIIPSLLDREQLLTRIRCELQSPEVLDNFYRPLGFKGHIRAIPLGTLLHITAGNVFLSSIDSLLMGFLTKNISIVKVSSENLFFPFYFAERLLEFDQEKILAESFCLLSWKGGDQQIESKLKKSVDAILAWGGEEMIRSYREGLPLHTKFLDFGPKISLQVISRAGFQQISQSQLVSRIVRDVVAWDQQACASPQNLFIQEGKEINLPLFLENLKLAFENYPYPRGVLTADEFVEWHKERYRALYSQLEFSSHPVQSNHHGQLIEGKNFMLHVDPNPLLRPSPLNRSLIIKRYQNVDDLLQQLSPFHYYLQSCSYALGENEKSAYLTELGLVGMKRFSPIGSIMEGQTGGPHDGRYVLRDLVHFISDEDESVLAKQDQLKQEESVRPPLMSAQDLKLKFEQIPHPPGYIFASGGTTGAPKYTHYSWNEFRETSHLLAKNFELQGLRPGMVVANMFVAGNLWSSFLAIDKALEKLQVIHLPIGGQCPSESALQYLQKFRPEVIMGLPSMLVQLAQESQDRGISLTIPKLFYAGEGLSEGKKRILQKIWQVQYFGSCGYASVDSGIIGYQCHYSLPGVHHLFSQHLSLEIVNEEGVVTSHLRQTLPIVRYRTGDRMTWVEGECPCGSSSDPRFQLLGRVDSLIQIWSARILLEDIEKALIQAGLESPVFQVVIQEEENLQQLTDHGMEEFIHLKVEAGKNISPSQLSEILYDLSRDLKDTVTFDFFNQHFLVEFLSPGSLSLFRNARTGKIPSIIDRRS